MDTSIENTMQQKRRVGILTRRNTLIILIFASAMTAAMQYIVQGSMATGGDPSKFGSLFWQIDYALWGVRALIEAWVIIYLFTTRGGNGWQKFVLTIFEAGLITLITLTIGPALKSMVLHKPISDILLGSQVDYWTHAIAAYTSLMMAGVGYAYRVQPADDEEVDPNEFYRLKELIKTITGKAEAVENDYQDAVNDAEAANAKYEEVLGSIEEKDAKLREKELEVVRLSTVNDERGNQVAELKGRIAELETDLAAARGTAKDYFVGLTFQDRIKILLDTKAQWILSEIERNGDSPSDGLMQAMTMPTPSMLQKIIGGHAANSVRGLRDWINANQDTVAIIDEYNRKHNPSSNKDRQ